MNIQRVGVGIPDESEARHWELTTGGTWDARFVELFHDGWLVAQWLWSAVSCRWYPTRRPTEDCPPIPADVAWAAMKAMP